MAILLILLCHSPCMFFYPGFIGVDIFLFLSGYTLCFSYETNKLSVFYFKRLKRIVPLYLVLSVAKSIMCVLNGASLSLWDLFCNLSSLSYYKLGGIFIEWYLSFLLILYLLFPILYKSVKRFRELFIGISILISVLIVGLQDLDPSYETAICRIPIFLFGIFCYINNKQSYSSKRSFGVILGMFFCAFIVSISLYFMELVNTYTLVYYLAPFLIYIISVATIFVASKFIRIKTLIERLGYLTLELYVANCIAMYFTDLFNPLIENDYLNYILLNALAFAFIYVISRLINSISVIKR